MGSRWFNEAEMLLVQRGDGAGVHVEGMSRAPTCGPRHSPVVVAGGVRSKSCASGSSHFVAGQGGRIFSRAIHLLMG